MTDRDWQCSCSVCAPEHRAELANLRAKLANVELGWSNCSRAAARLQTERDAARKELATKADEADKLGAENEALRERVAELGADAKRLDFLAECLPPITRKGIDAMMAFDVARQGDGK